MKTKTETKFIFVTKISLAVAVVVVINGWMCLCCLCVAEQMMCLDDQSSVPVYVPVDWEREREGYVRPAWAGRMRRHSIRLVKYLFLAALFLTLGPVTVKLMFGDQQQHDEFVHGRHVRRDEAVAHGLPVDPDDMQAVRYSPASHSQHLLIPHRPVI